MSSTTGLVLHHLEDSRSQRILWLLEELEVPYTLKIYKRLPTKLAPPELLAVHPLGKSPIITDDNIVVAESGAIVEYLIEKYGNGRFQPSADGKSRNLYYTHFSEGTLMPYLTNWFIFSLIPTRSPWFLRWILRPVMERVQQGFLKPNVNKATTMIEKDLEKSPTSWFAGGPEPTSADFMMLFPMEGLPRALGNNIPQHVRKWVDDAHARPAYKRALEKGGKYAYAKL